MGIFNRNYDYGYRTEGSFRAYDRDAGFRGARRGHGYDADAFDQGARRTWGAWDNLVGRNLGGYDRDFGGRGGGWQGYDRGYRGRWQTSHGDPFGDRESRTPIRVMRGRGGGYDRGGYDRGFSRGRTEEEPRGVGWWARGWGFGVRNDDRYDRGWR